MHLPALKNSVPASLDGQSIEDFIRNSTQNLQQVAAAMPGSGVAGAVYLGFDGTSGVWKLNKEVVDPKSLGRILVPQHGLFEGCIEWANGSPLQKIQRQLLGVHHDEPMSERLLPKPLSPNAYKKDTDGPTLVLGFVGFCSTTAPTWCSSTPRGAPRRRVNALATTATQAVVAFGEMVHPVIELGSSSYENAYRTIYDPKFNVIGYVTDKRAREADVISDDDIITRPTRIAGQAAPRDERGSGPLTRLETRPPIRGRVAFSALGGLPWTSKTSPQRTSPRRSAARLSATAASSVAARFTRRAAGTIRRWC